MSQKCSTNISDSCSTNLQQQILQVCITSFSCFVFFCFSFVSADWDIEAWNLNDKKKLENLYWHNSQSRQAVSMDPLRLCFLKQLEAEVQLSRLSALSFHKQFLFLFSVVLMMLANYSYLFKHIVLQVFFFLHLQEVNLQSHTRDYIVLSHFKRLHVTGLFLKTALCKSFFFLFFQERFQKCAFSKILCPCKRPLGEKCVWMCMNMW